MASTSAIYGMSPAPHKETQKPNCLNPYALPIVYPTLDLSDDEDEHVFRPRGRQQKDETWNPKGKDMSFKYIFQYHLF